MKQELEFVIEEGERGLLGYSDFRELFNLLSFLFDSFMKAGPGTPPGGLGTKFI